MIGDVLVETTEMEGSSNGWSMSFQGRMHIC